MHPLPTRAAGLDRLAQFTPRMGRAYAAERNYDPGPENRPGVSALSPWICRRQVLEAEAVAAALSAHSPSASTKFIEEVFWRGYFKGWLEHRPGIWADAKPNHPAPAGLEAAETGNTGIACFDAWARELVETGYLHNHARMWFASIWVFTLGLPWRHGADFFLRHLLDGDAASNTLSWRWVSGVHTRGKTYLARSSNIARYTAGRYPETPGLASVAPPVEEPPNPDVTPLRQPRRGTPVPSLYLVTTEDCGLVSSGDMPVAGVATLQLTGCRSARPVSPAVHAFDAGALADGAAQLGGAVQTLDHPTPADLVAAARAAGTTQIVTGFLHTGWVRDWFDAAEGEFDRAGITVAEIQRDWDRAVYPHCKSGYFGLKKKIPTLLPTIAPNAGMPLFSRV